MKQPKPLLKGDFLDFLSHEFRSAGVKIEIDGEVRGSRNAISKCLSLIFDVCASSTVASGKVALSGVGVFWVKNGVIKFRGSKRYREALQGFAKTIEPADTVRLRFGQFMAYLKLLRDQKTQHQIVVEKLASLM